MSVLANFFSTVKTSFLRCEMFCYTLYENSVLQKLVLQNLVLQIDNDAGVYTLTNG